MPGTSHIARDLQAPPRRLSPRLEAWSGWGAVHIVGLTWVGGLVPGGLGLWLYPKLPDLAVGLCVFGVLVLALAALATVGFMVRLARDARLVRSGCAATVTVLQNEALNVQDGFGGFHNVHYQFTTSKGEEIRGCWNQADPPLWDCKTGDCVTVLYLSRAPSFNVAYSCAMFRARE